MKWEEEFENEILPRLIEYGQNTRLRTSTIQEVIKSFITQTLQRSKEEERERFEQILNHVEVKVTATGHESDRAYQNAKTIWDIIWPPAKEGIIKAIRSTKEK